jgi:hypothetical protein
LAASFEEFNLAADRQNFIGYRVLPITEVAKQAGNYGVIPVEQLLQGRTVLRGPGGGYSRGNWQFTPQTYNTIEYGAEEPIDDNEATAYREYFDAEQVGAQRAMDAVLREAEKRVAAAVIDTTVWTGATLATAANSVWSNATNAVPITDVKNAKEKVWDGTGIWPNAVIMSRKNFMNCRVADQVKDDIASAGAGDSVLQREISVKQLAQAFDLDFVIVGGSAKNTANENQNVSIASVWSETEVMVCRIALTNDFREACIGRTFHWSEDGSSPGGTFESYRDETVRADIVRARHQVEEKILYTEMGHLITGVTT